MMGERVAVVGSRPPRRDAPEAEREAYRRLIAEVRAYVRSLPQDTIVVSGGALGVDTTAETVALERMMPGPIIYRPDYTRHGRRAPLVRNELIAQECERMVVFWDGKSRGCMHAAKLALGLGKRVAVYHPRTNTDGTLVTTAAAFLTPATGPPAYTGPALKKNSPEALARPEARAT